MDNLWINVAVESAMRLLSPETLETFERNSVKNLIYGDVQSIALPSLVLHASLRNHFGSAGWIRLASDQHLQEAIRRRAEGTCAFIERAATGFRALRAQSYSFQWIGHEGQVRIKSLTTDTHQLGTRPLLLEHGAGRAVLKFADPRPWTLLRACLQELSVGLGLNLTPPPVVASANQDCYLAEFIAATDVEESNDDVMLGLGALTAMAYCLRCVDLHIENVVVTKSGPVVVDPECVLYNFDGRHRPQALLETGLISTDLAVSAWRGGVEINGPIAMFEPEVDAQGVLRYVSTMGSYPNLARSKGLCIDPAQHATTFLKGYRAAQEWILAHRERIRSYIDSLVDDDFRVRLLIRETRLYSAAIHTLNLPAVDDYVIHVQQTLRRLRRAARMHIRAADAVFDAEAEDLLRRDVPYFWARAGERWLWHRRGPLQRLRCPRTIREQALFDLKHLRRRDIVQQLKILITFLRARPNRQNQS